MTQLGQLIQTKLRFQYFTCLYFISGGQKYAAHYEGKNKAG